MKLVLTCLIFVFDLALKYVVLAAGVAYAQHDERTKVGQYVAVCTSCSRNSSFGWAMCPDPLLISTWSLDMRGKMMTHKDR